ncbi:tRNA pseudouridine(38-40) synthase TruA [Thalassorhabdus alkalitolerans]|uniref:tRNA pseudouridine synthase A n=1 Tax=Thalassorhabdus alkalitolerans TaxID=2282697 RepID=A0ABW0YR34_9BACI
MRRVKCKIAYDGTHFAGWQVQPGQRTVQSCLEDALEKIHKGKKTKVTASGRTDSTVHAYGQVVHFDTPLAVPEDKWSQALTPFLPRDIQVKEAEYVEGGFHARYGAKEKEYRYRVLTGPAKDVFRRHYTYYVPDQLDINAMREAVSQTIGRHDFSSFCAANTDVVDKVRTIFKAEVLQEGDELIFVFRGNGFLYNMVRILVGTLLEVGKGKRSPESVGAAIRACDREAAGPTVPGHGLFLWEVVY